MAFCGKCGKEMEDGAQFCPSCGASANGKPAKRAAQVEEVQADANDAEQGKVMSILAYLFILCLIPLITGDYKKSPFVKYHLNQGLVLFIVWIAWLILSNLLGFIFSGVLVFLYILIRFVVWVGVIALAVIGIMNAVKGRMKPLPLIGGKFEIFK
ncbi:MAG: zinc-ribbon domain-containing protein [Treponema sp.]|jgi:uncharacterized membrane protein|nr:zinc-ribbon domain-containing protein [Treponema sp.]